MVRELSTSLAHFMGLYLCGLVLTREKIWNSLRFCVCEVDMCLVHGVCIF